VNARKVIAVDLGVESTWVVISRFNGSWLLDDVNRLLARSHPTHRAEAASQGGLQDGRIEARAGLTDNESQVERP
jgi:hypothetical protein